MMVRDCKALTHIPELEEPLDTGGNQGGRRAGDYPQERKHLLRIIDLGG